MDIEEQDLQIKLKSEVVALHPQLENHPEEEQVII